MCAPFMPLSCPGVIAGGAAVTQAPKSIGNSIVENVIAGMASAVEVAVEWTARLLTLWVLVPSSDLCPTNQDPSTWASDWVQQCNTADLPAQQLRSYLLPITILVAIGGLLWQAINIVITRKGEPVMQAVRGVWNTALWTGIGIAGTHAVLKAGDSYSMWILDKAIFSKSAKPPNEAMSAALVTALVPTTGGFAIAPFVVIVIGLIIMIVTLVQTILMVFREGSVVILAGVTQLAAAGTITRGTSPWLQKVLSWALALASYKAAVCTVYAATFAMMGGKPRDFIMGLAMLALSVIALPVLLKFFTIFTGSVGSGNGGMAMAGAATAAGLHAASTIRGAVGGNSASDHARFMDTNGPGAPGGNAPTGAMTTPPISMPAASGAAAPAAGPAAGGAAAAGSGAAAGSAAGGAAAGGAAAGGAAAAGAAGGPAGMVVAGTVVVGKAGYDIAKQGAAVAGSAMTEEGSQ